MNEERVVDIWFPGTGSYGSGYLLSDRLVLTARHVLKPRDPDTPCTVRQRNRVDIPLKAKVAWASDSLDIGLVRLDAPFAGTIGPGPDIGSAPTGLGSSNSYPCRAIGFPRANRDEDALRGDQTVEGSATLQVRSGVFDFVTNVQPANAGNWSGFSGAAVFRGDLLFAIVSEVPLNWGGGKLTAVAADKLLADPGFCQAFADTGCVPPVKRKLRHARFYGDLWQRLLPYCHYVDRTDQLDQFSTSLGPEARGAFVFGGEREDCPEYLLQRLSETPEFHARIGNMPMPRAIPKLEWPSAFSIADPQAALDRLVADCAVLLSLPPAAAASAQAFAAELNKRSPAALWWEINPPAMGPGHSDLLARWIGFCEAVQATAPLYWFAYWLLSEPTPPRAIPSFFQRPAAPDPAVETVFNDLVASKRAAALAPLEPINPTHMAAWFEAIREKVPFDEDDRLQMSERIRNQFNALPLGAFARLVATRLREADA